MQAISDDHNSVDSHPIAFLSEIVTIYYGNTSFGGRINIKFLNFMGKNEDLRQDIRFML